MRCFGARAALLMFVLLVAGFANAQYAGQATLNAVVYRPIPAGQGIYVRALDNSPHHQEIQRRFQRALEARGYLLDSEPTGLVLTVEPRDQIGSWSYRSGALVEAQRGYNEIARKDLDSYTVNLFNSRQGGLINRPDRPAAVNRSRYRLEARLEDRSNGRTLWQGWSSADLAQGDGRSLLESMVEPLAGVVGISVREQQITLR